MNLEVNKRVRMMRKLMGLSQREIAEMLGKKSSTYSQCERGGQITCGMIISLAEILCVDVRTLLYGECIEPPLPPPPPLDSIKLTKKEENFIKILRNLSSERRNAVINFIESNYKEDKYRKQKEGHLKR